MRIRDFVGADYEPASKFLGAVRHSSHGTRSFWYGADELCFLLSQADHAFVAEHDSTIVGLAIVKNPETDKPNQDLRMHWLQQRQIISTVCVSFGINPREDQTTYGSEPTGILQEELGDAADLVTFICVSDEADSSTLPALERAVCSYLADHGVEVQDAKEELFFLPTDPDDHAIQDQIANILDAHSASHGRTFKPFLYRVEQDDKVVAGIFCWTYGSDLYVDMLGVDESLRRQGIGAKLIGLAEEWGRTVGCQTMSLDTFSHQAPNYYPRLGFTEIFRRTFKDGSERVYFTKDL